MNNFSEHVSFIWSIAEILRGNYKQSEYGKVVLPFTVLRRLDCVLEESKQAVLDKAASLPKNIDSAMAEIMLNNASGHNFHNTSKFTFAKLLDDPANIAANLNNIINNFSEDAREIFVDRFELPLQIARLDRDNLLYLVVQKFAQTDLHPDTVDNTTMGYIFEELIRRFSEQSNETAGEHFTPREVIRLMVNLLFAEDSEALTKKSVIRKLYDPACGTGGMLSEAEKYLKELNKHAHLEVYGQELNGESFGICKSDMMIKGQNPRNIKYGNSFSDDGLSEERFDYMLSNPPFGVEWRKVEKQVRKEAEDFGFDGRFGVGLPRVSDGSLLFVQHMISKMNTNKAEQSTKSKDQPARIAVVLNGSPLFTGGAGSGESEIRRWIIENDWLEAIVALPTDMFYNTGIATYIWIITNKKKPGRKGKVQLINATDLHVPMRKSLGSKRKQISDEQIKTISELFDGDLANSDDRVKWFNNVDFGYSRITVERPLQLNFAVMDERIKQLDDVKAFTKLSGAEQHEIKKAIQTLDTEWIYINREEFIADLKSAFKSHNLDVKGPLFKAIWTALSERDETADVCIVQSGKAKGSIEPDPELRDYENVPLTEDIEAYFQREVIPHVPDAWIDHEKTKVGYEIPFNRHFYRYVPPRSLEEIDADLDKVSAEIMDLLREVHV
ncbi:restriction endonuclease subunit M [Bacterioplanes sanyensis]|uniref:site-specific DNA-methyltransferase (adenine-specific) n=1 Tax=Bacterioplanes sanyensis TaxID=1249553 RepID=A0A222FKQ9_9GAMM|nr:class I SAM-dependent DNA methyltransferase [Bacterioplanes sanyensis]ASP39598.1 restriction endonuclease subunit M [Bacterioplanes sanyensis]